MPFSVRTRLRSGCADSKRWSGDGGDCADLPDHAARLHLELEYDALLVPVLIGAEETVVIAIEYIDVLALRPFVGWIVIVGLDRLAARDDDGPFAGLREGAPRVLV